MGAQAVKVAREMASARDPREMAAAAGARFDGTTETGEFQLVFLGETISLGWPTLAVPEGQPSLPDHVLALLIYYLALSDGTPPRGETVSFGELPDAMFYAAAFRGYTGAALVREFASDPGALDEAADSVGGVRLVGLADRAWHFDALPRVPVTLAWWDADDEFEARAEVMFDATASHHLTTDGCAVLGSWLTATLRMRRGG